MAAVENAYAPAPALGEEMGPIIAALKEGSAMTRYYSKNKTPDLRIFMLKMEEFQVVWCRTGKEGGRLEGSGISMPKPYVKLFYLPLEAAAEYSTSCSVIFTN